MSEAVRDAYQREVDKTHAIAQEGIEYGTIGWAGNPEVMQVGTGGDDGAEEGSTLFRVTLYRGRLPGGNPTPGVAEGMEILADFMGPLFVPYPAGKRVVIAWPNKTPGAPALILGTVGASPAQQFKAGRACLDVGPDCDLVLQGKSAKLMDHLGDADGAFGAWLGVGALGPNGEPMIFGSDGAGGSLSVGLNAAGMTVGDGGSGVSAALSLGGPNASVPGVGLCYNGQGFITLDDTGAWDISGQSFGIGCGTVSLGVQATPATPVLLGVTGMAGVGSLTIFGQP